MVNYSYYLGVPIFLPVVLSILIIWMSSFLMEVLILTPVSIEISVSSVEPGQTPQLAASELDLHFFAYFPKRASGLKGLISRLQRHATRLTS